MITVESTSRIKTEELAVQEQIDAGRPDAGGQSSLGGHTKHTPPPAWTETHLAHGHLGNFLPLVRFISHVFSRGAYGGSFFSVAYSRTSDSQGNACSA